MVVRPGEPNIGKGFTHLGLETPRLRVTCFSGKWAAALDGLLRVPDIRRTFGPAYDSVDTLSRSPENPREFMLIFKDSARCVGWTQLADSQYLDGWLDLRYVMHPDFRRQGLCKEGLKKLVPYALDQWGFPGISAVVPDGNLASHALAIALGMQPLHHPEVEARGKTLFTFDSKDLATGNR